MVDDDPGRKISVAKSLFGMIVKAKAIFKKVRTELGSA
jgi:hypothetical protein